MVQNLFRSSKKKDKHSVMVCELLLYYLCVHTLITFICRSMGRITKINAFKYYSFFIKFLLRVS